jgi:hypothetical protein
MTFGIATEMMRRKAHVSLTDIFELTKQKIGTEFNQLLHLKLKRGKVKGDRAN